MRAGLQVYLLENLSGRRYIGISEDVYLRLIQHNEGKSKWTSKFRPWKLIWLSPEMALRAARKLENALKRQKGGAGLQSMLLQNGRFIVDNSGS